MAKRGVAWLTPVLQMSYTHGGGCSRKRRLPSYEADVCSARANRVLPGAAFSGVAYAGAMICAPKCQDFRDVAWSRTLEGGQC